MDPNTALTLTDDVTADLVRKKVNCPFLGSAVHQKFLAVRGDADNPLAEEKLTKLFGRTILSSRPASLDCSSLF